MSSGAGESVSSVWSRCKPSSVQHHQSGCAVGVLSRADGASRIQAETLQDQDARLSPYSTSSTRHDKCCPGLPRFWGTRIIQEKANSRESHGIFLVGKVCTFPAVVNYY